MCLNCGWKLNVTSSGGLYMADHVGLMWFRCNVQKSGTRLEFKSKANFERLKK